MKVSVLAASLGVTTAVLASWDDGLELAYGPIHDDVCLSDRDSECIRVGWQSEHRSYTLPTPPSMLA